jgi:hypothetical protein
MMTLFPFVPPSQCAPGKWWLGCPSVARGVRGGRHPLFLALPDLACAIGVRDAPKA